jgi:hypothetical protein
MHTPKRKSYYGKNFLNTKDTTDTKFLNPLGLKTFVPLVSLVVKDLKNILEENLWKDRSY